MAKVTAAHRMALSATVVEDKIKTGLTQRHGEHRERLLMGKFCHFSLSLRSLRLKRAKRTGVNQVFCFCFSCFTLPNALLERNS